LNVFRGYRDYVKDRAADNPFAPGGARSDSWSEGSELARQDLLATTPQGKTTTERAALALELMQELGDTALAPDAACRCDSCVQMRRTFNLKVAKLLCNLMIEGGM